MKYIVFIIFYLFCFTISYSQNNILKGKLVIEDVDGFMIRKSQLNDSLELVIDLKIDAMLTVNVYWEDSTINKMRWGVLNSIGAIPTYILSEWKKIPVNGLIIFGEPRCVDKKKNEAVDLEVFSYKVTN